LANPLFDTLFGRHADKSTAFLHLENGEILSHDGFLRITARFAGLFCQLGLTPGDRLAVQVEKSAQSLAIYAACVQSGIVFLPLNPAYTANELSYFVQNSGARLLVCDSAKRDSLTPIAQAAGAMLETLDIDGSGTLSAKSKDLPEHFETVARSGDDLAAFL